MQLTYVPLAMNAINSGPGAELAGLSAVLMENNAVQVAAWWVHLSISQTLCRSIWPCPDYQYTSCIQH